MTDEMRIKLKVGAMELEFEGGSETFEKKIEPLLVDLIAFGKESDIVVESSNENGATKGIKPSTVVPPMTVKSVAMRLGGDSGSALLYAAVASLAVVKNRETFTRQDLNDEMKLAVGFYKPTYSNNLSKYLETLSKQGTIIEAAKDTYALKETERELMEQKLAQ